MERLENYGTDSMKEKWKRMFTIFQAFKWVQERSLYNRFL